MRQQKSERLQVTTLNYPHLLYQQAFVMQQTSRSLIQMRVEKEGTHDIAPRDKESPPPFASNNLIGSLSILHYFFIFFFFE